MDIHTRLKQDHDRHRQLATQIAETSGASDERRHLWQEFRADVEAHANAEEQTFYAEILESPDAQEKARHSIAEHEEASGLVEKVEQCEMSSPAWLQHFKTLREELEHHMEEEEDEVFPLARGVLDDRSAKSLATRFDERKGQEKHEAS